VSKYDVIHKTGSTLHITTPAEEDRATAIGNMHKKFGEDRTCISEDMIADRQTRTPTHTETDTLITILRSAIGSAVISHIHERTAERIAEQKNLQKHQQSTDHCLV